MIKKIITLTENTAASLAGMQVVALSNTSNSYVHHNGQSMRGPTMRLRFLASDREVCVGKGSSVHVAGWIWHVTNITRFDEATKKFDSCSERTIELTLDLRNPISLSVDLDSIRASLSSVLTLCDKWRYHPPDMEDLSTVFRTPSLAATAATVVPETFRRTNSLLPILLDRFLENRQSIVPRHDPDLAESELQRPCSLHLVDIFGVIEDDMVADQTDHYVQQTLELPPWDTWVWRENCFLISWIPEWMQQRMNYGIISESAGAHSWLRVNRDDHLELLGYSVSGL